MNPKPKRKYRHRKRLEIPTQPRTCLKCLQTFPSTGPGNRICKRCLRENQKVAQVLIEPTGPNPQYPKMKPSGSG